MPKYVTFMGILFLAIGFLITDKNAQYLLAGYNTMSEEKRKNFNLPSFLVLFKKAHIFLGLSLLLLGYLLYYLDLKNFLGLFLVVYPLLIYAILIWKSRKYYASVKSNYTMAMVITLILMVCIIIPLYYHSTKENEFEINENSISLTGFYGEKISIADLKSVALIKELPNIEKRSNGFSNGFVRKGDFKLDNGKTVKLLLNTNESPYILLITNAEKRIYYASGSVANQNIYNQLKEWHPQLNYNP